MDGIDASLNHVNTFARIDALVAVASVYHDLVRSRFTLEGSALASFIERGCFDSKLSHNGADATILDRFPEWARERALVLEQEIVLELSSLYRRLLDALNLGGELPDHFAKTRLGPQSHALDCLTRIDDLADLAKALIPFARGILQLAAMT